MPLSKVFHSFSRMKNEKEYILLLPSIIAGPWKRSLSCINVYCIQQVTLMENWIENKDFITAMINICEMENVAY